MVQPLLETVWWALKKLKIESPFDLAISLLAVYSKKLKAGSQGDICAPMFIAALFTVAKLWKQPIDRWVDKQDVEHHTRRYHSALKNKEILAVTWMNPEDTMYAKWKNSFQKYIYNFTYMRYQE